ncbi:MAG: VOC family protein [Chitinophagales bacterium]|nr:VOC family protein [Chitinophagaceae bacterium]MCB9065718.1 VOC family protein [Chitinophagales bacterium]
MTKVNIPEQYKQVMPYLIIENASGFMDFLIAVFGATEQNRTMRDEHVIMHAEAGIGDCTIMFADATEEFTPLNSSMFIYVTDADAAFIKAIEKGAMEIMPPADQDYGRSCGVQDPFGNTWWITSVKS